MKADEVVSDYDVFHAENFVCASWNDVGLWQKELQKVGNRARQDWWSTKNKLPNTFIMQESN